MRIRMARSKASRMSSLPTVSRALAAGGLVPLEARILLAHVLGRDRSWIAAHGDADITREQATMFDALARRRRNGEPIAYLVGHREFFGLDLEVTPDVLIPRPETELLVELTLARIAKDTPACVLDLGCGSGAVALALARERPRASVVGAGVSPAAVALCRRNAARLGIANAAFAVSDWFSSVPTEPYDAIVANPPYIAVGDPHLSEGDVRFEPCAALVAGADGLDAIRAIVAAAPAYLVRGHWFAVEHGYDQAERVRALLLGAGFVDVQSARDLAGIFRVTRGRRELIRETLC